MKLFYRYQNFYFDKLVLVNDSLGKELVSYLTYDYYHPHQYGLSQERFYYLMDALC